MKTKSVILIALVAISASVLAGTKPVDSKVVVVNQKSGMFKVIYQGSGAVTMTIADKNGDVLFKEVIKTENGFIRPVNFSGMQPGAYSIVIADASGEQTQTVNYSNEAAVKNVHIARVGQEDKYLLAIANGNEQEINVKIYDGQDNLVYSENRIVNGNFGLVYNLQKVSGVPTIQVTDHEGNDVVISKK